MIGLLWNVTGFNKTSRCNMVAKTIRDNRVDFIGTQETKKVDFHPSFLKELSNGFSFNWNLLLAIGTAGGILIGVRDDLYQVVVGEKT